MRKDGHAPLLIVVAGPNGSGKTTITSEVIECDWMEDAVYTSPDNVAIERFGDWNSAEAVLEAARYCERWREKCLCNRKSLILKRLCQLLIKLTSSAEQRLPDIL